ncbi:MAG: serine/threonine protein kinase [Planctomycetota bacterium]|nr:MAG: serine/threonine protein kinase [Planctomycetota bacterium]
MTMLAGILEGTQLQGRFATYTTVCELRRGGMGVVVLATAYETGSADGVEEEPRQVVVKIALRDDELARGRMQQEITALQALQHPQVVSVVDDGIYHDHAWYAMDYVGPCNLGDILLVRTVNTASDLPSVISGILDGDLQVVPRSERIGIPVATAVSVMIQVAETVAHAHRRGVLHRDLKPSNILLDDSGSPVLCDFGVARAASLDWNLTAVDEVVGTMEYISPEQLAGHKPDERADVYAMGAMLHECLCGQLPPRRQFGWEPLPHMRGLPRPLVQVVRHALHPDPGKRLRSAEALAADLRRFDSGQPVLAPQLHWYHALWRLAYHRPMTSGFALMIATLVILLIVVMGEAEGMRSAQWHAPTFELQGRELAQHSFTINDPAWADAPHGQIGIAAAYPRLGSGDGQRHIALGWRVPLRGGQRLSIEVDTRSADQEIGLFLSDHPSDWQQGYWFQLGAYDNTCTVLRRGNSLLWLAPQVLEPGQRLELFLEQYGDHIRAGINGQVLVELRDMAPLTVRSAGVLTYAFSDREYTDPPVYRRMALSSPVRASDLSPDLMVATYAMVGDNPDERANGAASSLRLAEALAQRLSTDDRRLPLLLLRKERIRSTLPQSDRPLRDLSAYRQQLHSLAEYHLHQLLVQSETGQRREQLRQAGVGISGNELSRLVLAIENHLPLREWVLLLDSLLELSSAQPLVYDYILWRALQAHPQRLGGYRRWGQLVDYLGMRPSGSFWVRAIGPTRSYRQWWQELAAGREILRDLGDNSMLREVVPFWLAQLRYGHGDQEDMTTQYEGLVLSRSFDLERPLRMSPTGDLWDRYGEVEWFHLLTMQNLPPPTTRDLLDQEMRARILALNLLLAPQGDEPFQALPYHLYALTGGLLEVLLAGVVSGLFPPSLILGVLPDDAQVSSILQWLLDAQAQPELMPDPVALGPGWSSLLRLAQAQRLYDVSADELSQELLRSLAADRPWIPAHQAAAAILVGGWPQ